MEETVKLVALHLSIIVEGVAALVIAIALLRFLIAYLPSSLKKDQHYNNSSLRVRFGSSLTIALELLLAADILQTAVAPTWDDIGKLAAIAAIRTILNFFLEKELKGGVEREESQAGMTDKQPDAG